MKQKTLRVFEVEDFKKLKTIIESKYELVKDYFFMLKTEDKEIENFLKEHNLNYFILSKCSIFKKNKYRGKNRYKRLCVYF